MEDIKNQISELDKKATALQIESTTQKFTINFTDATEYKDILKFIDKDYSWKANNAALTAHVYDSIKEASKSATVTEGGVEMELKATILSGLYNILLNIESTGVEKARKFTRILANLGQQITDAMNKLAADNEEIQALHVQIQELEQKLVENETSEQIEEEA